MTCQRVQLTHRWCNLLRMVFVVFISFLCPLKHSFGQVDAHAPTKEPSDQIQREAIKILFVGDVMLDGGPGHVVASGKDPFAACQELFAGVDLCVANLECVIGNGGEQQLKPYVFHGASDSPRFLKKYFHVVSLANNHSMDYGKEGMSEMLNVLEREKLPYFGAGRNLQQANKPFVIEIKGHKIALLGFNEFRSDDYAATKDSAGNAPLREAVVSRSIKNARDKLGCNVVIPYLHWGEELVPEPRPDQRQLAKKWVEDGATAVIGAHPHVTQTVEVHRGAPIIYSLGNFVFDYFPVDPPEWVGWVVILEIEADGTVGLDIRSVVIEPSGCPKISPTE
jgi:poly-gamma-glutamate capsule biosynthesis protein CapA/YwtB (metallophosphatase superfamily)